MQFIWNRDGAIDDLEIVNGHISAMYIEVKIYSAN